jgi:hypothetical protein
MRSFSQGGCGSERRENQDRWHRVAFQQPTAQKLENVALNDLGNNLSLSPEGAALPPRRRGLRTCNEKGAA